MTPHEFGTKVKENLDLFMSIAEDEGYIMERPTLIIRKAGFKRGGFFTHKTLGYAITGEPGKITLNQNFVDGNEDEMAWDTLGHEFAHCIQYQHNLFTIRGKKRMAHDNKFKQLCRMLGVSDSTTHRMTAKGKPERKVSSSPFGNRPHTAHCSCKEYAITTRRANKMRHGSSYRCMSCGTPLSLGRHPTRSGEIQKVAA